MCWLPTEGTTPRLAIARYMVLVAFLVHLCSLPFLFWTVIIASRTTSVSFPECQIVARIKSAFQ